MSEFAADEVAPALGLSRNAATTRLDMAFELSTRLTGTFNALAVGALDLPKARAITESTRPLAADQAGAVERRVLARSRRQTVGQLRASLNRAILAVDPDGAERRHARVRKERRVVCTPLPDGMAELWALLPADGAVAVYNTVDKIARAAKTPDDERAA